VKIVKYGIFCVLVLVASILIRRPADVPERETTPVERAEGGNQVTEMQKSSVTSRLDDSNEDDENDEDDDDEDEDDED
jgi:hypothetical protein